MADNDILPTRESQAGILLEKTTDENKHLRTENQALRGALDQKERETKRWAWIATGASAVGIILMISLVWQSPAPAAHPPVAQVAASAPPTAKPATPALPVAEGPPATLPDTETCEEILRPTDFLEGEGKFGAVCGNAVYRIDSSKKEDGRFVHTDLVLLPDVTP